MLKQSNRPTKIIIMNIPAQGHINPTLPVVAELIRRNIEVIYYDTEEFRASIEPSGAVFRAYPPPVPSAADVSHAVNRSVINFTVMIFQVSQHLTAFMLEEIRREQPALVLHDSACLWGMQAARLAGIPAVSSHSTFVLDNTSVNMSLGDLLFVLGGALSKLPQFVLHKYRLRKRYGAASLPPGPIFPLRGGLNLVYTSKELQPPTPLIDDTFHFVGPSINPGVCQTDFPFEQLDDRPRVYISFGTIHDMKPDFYHACFEAFADHPGQVILSTGRRITPESLGKAPSNFIVRSTVPQLEILQRCAIFVTHAGLNSLQESLYYGVPMVLVPYQFEQLLNARVVARVGAGVIANEKPPYGKAASMRSLRELADRVLHDATMKQAAETLGGSLRKTGGYRQAADEISAFLNGHSANQNR